MGTGAEEKLKRLYPLIEEGVADRDEILEGRLAALKDERHRAKAALDRIHVAERPLAEIVPELIEQFGRLTRENVTTGEIPFRKAWLRAIVDRVAVNPSVIRIIGEKAKLKTAIAGAA